LVGRNEGSVSSRSYTITNSYATGNASGTGNYIGSFVGANNVSNSSTITITNSYAIGNVSGTGDYVGSFVGNNSTGTITIKNCYAAGNNNDGRYYDYTGNSISITMAEIRSEDFFTENLQIGAVALSANSWIYSSGEYPTLSNELASNILIGTGTQSDPYIIETKLQLKYLSAHVYSGRNFSNKYIKLGANINLNDTPWIPIGTSSTSSFQGTFDGNRHIVSGVYINSTSNNQGLFGYVGSGGTIKNLGVITSYIKGGGYVGGLAGINGGTITNCYTIGNVEGTSNVGGLVGQNSSNGTISNCYAIGNVEGTYFIGGLVGQNSSNGTISNCYAIGNVEGTYIGGLVGSNSGAIRNSYAPPGNNYDGSYYNYIGTTASITTAEIKSEDFFVENLQLGAVALSANSWIYSSGEYPTLSNELASNILIGTGTQSDPYIIETKLQLKYLSAHVYSGRNFSNEYIKLGANINLNDAPWIPIGTSSTNSFQGTFDGDGHIINSIYINSTSNYQGLFGYVNGGTIKNLGIVASYVKGGTCVGNLAGYTSNSTISNSYATGNVNGTNYVGGLVGNNSGSKISSSYTTGDVSGTYVGGLAGNNNSSTIENSYATGNISGSYTGGLVGIYGGTIKNSYASGNISGTGNFVGSLVGSSGGTTISSYYNSQASDPNDNGAGIPKSPAEMQTKAAFADWDFNAIWRINSEINNGYPHLRAFFGSAAIPYEASYERNENDECVPVTYTIIYDLDDGIVSPANPASYTIETPTFTLNNPSKTGYTFAGWTGANGTTRQIAVSIALGSTGDKNYTANWTLNTYTVIFVDYDGTELSRQTINHSSAANAPATNPAREGYTFTGWDVAFSNVTAELIVTALYNINTYTVTFKNWDGTTLEIQTIEHGSDATAPATNPAKENHTFTGWDVEFGNVTGDLTVTAVYAIFTYDVTFKNWDGTVLKTETVEHGSAASAPATAPIRAGHVFTGWSVAFDNVTEDLTVTAEYGATTLILPQIATNTHLTQTQNTLSLTSKTNATIAVYNLSGKLISRQNYIAGNHSISLGHLPKGMYIVKASFGGEEQILRMPVR